MTQSLIGSGSADGVVSTANTTQYWPSSGRITAHTTEANTQLVIREAGVLSDLYVRLIANSVNASTTFRTRKNAANGAQSVSFAASTSGTATDSTNTDTIASADKINIQSVPGAGSTGTFELTLTSSVFDPTDTDVTLSRMALFSDAVGTISFSGGSTTRFVPLNGHSSSTISTTEANSYGDQRIAGTFRNTQCYIASNARSTTTTAKMRENAADTVMAASIGAGATGLFEDTTHTFTVGAGDDVVHAWTTGSGSGAIVINNLAADFVNLAGEGYSQLMSARAAGESNNANVTRFIIMNGGCSAVSTESETQMTARLDGTLSDITVNQSANSVSVATVYKTRINGADGNCTVSVAASTTGIHNGSGTDVIDPADEINLAYTATGGTGSGTFRTLAIWLQTEATGGVLVQRTIDEGAVTIGASTIVRKVKRPLTESAVTIAASIIIPRTKRVITESSVIIAASTILTKVKRPITESTISLADSISRRLLARRTITEAAVEEDDTVAGVKKQLRSITDGAVNISDSLLLRVRMTMTEAAVSIADTVARELLSRRTMTEDSVATSDSLSLKTKRIVQDIAVSVADELTKRLFARRTVTESAVEIDDTIAKEKTQHRSMSEDAVPVSDSLFLKAKRIMSEAAISISDSLSRMYVSRRVISESGVSVEDSLTIRIKRVISDSLTIAADSITRKVTRTMSEPATEIGDEVTAIRPPIRRTVNEPAMDITDTLVRSKVKRIVTEPAVVITDRIEKIFRREITEAAVSIADAIGIIRVFVGTVGRAIKRRIFGSDYSFR